MIYIYMKHKYKTLDMYYKNYFSFLKLFEIYALFSYKWTILTIPKRSESDRYEVPSDYYD